jgi:exodeoxyribonuclease V gamma subunit
LIKLPELEVHQLKVEKVKKGELPLKFMADIAINEVREEIETTKNLFIECVGSATEASAAIEIEIDSSLLKGTLNGIYQDKIVMVCFSKTEDKYLIEAHLKYLIATAAGLNLEFVYISKAKEDCFTANPLTPTDALNRLQKLVQVYKRGSKTIVPVFPHLGIKPKEVDELTADAFNVKIEDLFNRFTGPCTDEYLVSEYRFGFFEREDVVEEFKANAALVIKPLAEIFPDYYN